MMLLNSGAGEDSWKFLVQPKGTDQSIIKGINPEYSLEELILKLKFQWFGHIMRRAENIVK